MATTSSSPVVLYVDHQGHPAPLSETFYATASRRLSSTIDRTHRPSTVTQVDSAYCPQCLSFHDASSATQLGYCPKPTCLRCPLCTSIVSCRKVDNAAKKVFAFACGRCDWESTQCNLQVDSTSGDSAATTEEVANAVTQLSTKLQERRQEGGHAKATEEHYQSMVSAWEGIVKSGPKSATRGLQFKGGRRPKDTEESWSVESLESAIKTKKEDLAAYTVVGGKALQRISLEEGQTLDAGLQDKPTESLALQALTGAPTMKMADLLPLQVPLRSRKSRRCRAELAEGKPGILLKPKLNPLEGDSSLRTGHGQWWKKDSSAVHVVPRARVVRHGSKAADDGTQQHAFVLKVTNSTLGLVRLQIGLSAYQGESYWEDQATKNPAMEGLLVETLSNKHIDAFLQTPKHSSQQKFLSELVVLDSAEDSIVDIGKVVAMPDEVSNWDAQKVLEAAPGPSEAPEENKVSFVSVRLVAEKSGSAWFELICVTKPNTSDSSKYPDLFWAIPVSLQIEVGNGSWESSLIKAQTGDKPDMVSFDLMLAWPSKE